MCGFDRLVGIVLYVSWCKDVVASRGATIL